MVIGTECRPNSIRIRSQAFRMKRVSERQRKIRMEKEKKNEMNTFELWCFERYTSIYFKFRITFQRIK